MIANCPSCGTHFKLDRPPTAARARCGRCDSDVDLSHQRTYRIVDASRAQPVARAAAAAVAATVPDFWKDPDPLPAIPEMARRGAFEASVPPVAESDILPETVGEGDMDALAEAVPESQATIATLAMWVAAGAIAGTGISWMSGGETLTGVAAGAATGVVAAWGWARWTSPK